MNEKSEIRAAVVAAQRAALAAAEKAVADLHGASELNDETVSDPSEVAQSSVELGTSDGMEETLRRLRGSLARLESIELTALTTVGTGAVVQVGSEIFFISVSADDVEVNGMTVEAISPESPFAQAMLGKSAGDSFNVRGTEYRIDRVS